MSRERLRWLVWLLAVLLAVILLADEWLSAQRSWRGDLELVFPEAIASVCNVTVVGTGSGASGFPVRVTLEFAYPLDACGAVRHVAPPLHDGDDGGASTLLIAAPGNCSFEQKVGGVGAAGALGLVVPCAEAECDALTLTGERAWASGAPQLPLLIVSEACAHTLYPESAIAQLHLTKRVRRLPLRQLLCVGAIAALALAARSARLASLRHSALRQSMRLWNLKQWWRNLGNVGGLFLVATFLDDGLRSLLYWRLQLEVVADPWGALRERPAVQALCAAMLAVATATQLLASVALIARWRTALACQVLVGWSAAQIAMYGQWRNVPFVAHSSAVCGGLLITLCREQRLVLEPRAHARLHLIARCLIAMLFLEEGYQRGSSVLAEVADDATVPNVLADAFLLLLFVAMTALVLVGLHARWAAGAMVLVGVVDNFQSNFFLFDLAHPLAHLGELQKMLLTHQYRFFQELSTLGALLLLVVHGPGDISLDAEGGGGGGDKTPSRGGCGRPVPLAEAQQLTRTLAWPSTWTKDIEE